MQFCDPYGWHAVDAETIQEIRRKLAAFETRTWAEIFISAKKQNHSIPLRKLCAVARNEANRVGINVDELHTLRLTGKQRVWGIFSRGVFDIIWWDPSHNVYPVGLQGETSN